MYKAKKKPKMAMGGMTSTPKMSLNDSLVARAQRRKIFDAQRAATAQQQAAAQKAGLQYNGAQQARAAATPEQIRFAQAEQKLNQANKAQAANQKAQFVQASNKAMQTFNNTAKPALANILNPLNSRVQAARASQAQKAPTGTNNTGAMQMPPTQATPTVKPAAARRSNRFSRQAAKAAPKPMMAKGGMVKSNCGASMKPTQKGKK